MTSTDLAPAAAPTRQALATKGRSRALKVSGKLKIAIDHMVWTVGADYQAAGAHAGLTAHSVRSALEKPHVKQYYEQQLQVLRTSERARNIHAAIEVRDQTANQSARIQGARFLEEAADAKRDSAGHRVSTPGVTIYIGTERTARDADKAMIEINPLSEHDNTEHGA